jgi:hypothetical protein
MTPAEIIKQRAEAVTGFDKMTMADHHEAIAKMLRKEAAQDQKQAAKQAFAAAKEPAKRGRERFIAGFRGMREGQVKSAFAGSDWVKMKEGDGVATYCRKGMGHLYINVKGDEFSVTEGETTGQYALVSNLAAFISEEKKKRGL